MADIPPVPENPEPESRGNGRNHPQLPRLPAYGRILRDATSFGLGVFVAIHETMFATNPREALLVLAAALLGLPVVMRKDERK